MADLEHYRRQGAEVAKRLKKAELVDFFVRALHVQAVDVDALKARIGVLEREAAGDEPEVPSPDDTRVSGVSLGEHNFVDAPVLFEFATSYGKLVDLLGEPNVENAVKRSYATTTAWALNFAGYSYTLRDFKMTKAGREDAPFADVKALRKAESCAWQVIGGSRASADAVRLRAALLSALSSYDGDPLPPTRLERAVKIVLSFARSDAMREALNNFVDAARVFTEREEKMREELAEAKEDIEQAEKERDEAEETSTKYDTALCDVLADRDALLKRLGLTDREWSAMGGACEADFDL